jgi:Icc protein
VTTIHDAELFTLGPDEAVVTFRTDARASVAVRVGDREVASEGTHHLVRVDGLEPAIEYALEVEGAPASELLPASVTTLARPAGALLSTFATVNDVHFGEEECGKLGTPEELGPVFATVDGETPYWQVMNDGALEELTALAPDAVIVKGDLTDVGSDEEYQWFLDSYSRLGPRMHHVRGNHDAMLSPSIAVDHVPFAVDVRGATLAVIDTVMPGTDRGRVSSEQLEWLDGVAASSTVPVFVFGHHHPWDPASHERDETYFGINPDDSEKLCAVIARRESIVGYFAGHTHRNRVRRFPVARDVPIVEIACVKDYPGAWAEYRVYEGGYVQLTRRISSVPALQWTEKTRHMFAGLYRDYALGRLEDRCFTYAF